MPSFKQPEEGPQTQTDIPVLLLEARAKLDQRLDVNVYLAMRVISDIKMTDQLRSSEGLNVPGKRKARGVCHACNQHGHWAGDPQCPGRPVDKIELENEVQEFEPNQDARMRQVLSVQDDVSEVRSLRPSTRLVLSMNSTDVGRREGARGVTDTAARYTVAGRAWDRAYRQTRIERGIGLGTEAY